MNHVDASGALVAAPGGARWRSCLWDYLVIVAWIAAVTAAGLLLRTWWPVDVSSAPVLLTDTVAFVSTVLPTWIYLTVSEAGARQASWGKRLRGLRVVATPEDTRVGFGRSALRNGVKLLPWQFAHIAVARMILSVDGPVLIATTYALALVVPVGSVVVAWRDSEHRALHDFVAGTRVVSVRCPEHATPAQTFPQLRNDPWR